MSASEPTLELFAEHLRYTNPFDENRVTQTDSLSSDVPAIHADAFDELTRRAHKASQNKDMGTGVVVTGPPGVGKSHLLARFGEWARREKYPFVYLLNLQAGPNDILRTILRTSISILTKGLSKSPAQSRLFRMVSATINHALTSQKITQAVDLPTAQRAYESLVNRLEGDAAIYHVLWLFFDDIFRRSSNRPATGLADLAKRWLSGGYLDPAETKRLELKGGAFSEEGLRLDVEQMKEVIKVLCQFAGFRQRSFILCFDQVDTLTEDQVQSWSSTAHALLDICPRLLIVTSGVDDTFIEWTRNRLMPQSSWDRIRQFSIGLSGIDADAARTMVKDRLQRSLHRFDSLPDIHQLREQDELFPLGKAWADDTLLDSSGDPKSDLRPRSIINRAGNGWDQESSNLSRLGIDSWLTSWPHFERPAARPEPVVEVDLPKLIDQRIAQKLEEHRQSRLLRPEELPVDAGNVVGLLISLLQSSEKAASPFRTDQYSRLEAVTVPSAKVKKKPAFQFLVEQRLELPDDSKRTIGVTVAEAAGGNAATNMLKRILAELDAENGPAKAILIVDSREPLKLAPTGQDCLDQLKSRAGRFSMEMLDFEQYATLDAFEAVVGLARSGDLEIMLPNGASRSITEAEAYESHHRHQRYLNCPVLCQLIGKCNTAATPTTVHVDPQRVVEVIQSNLAISSTLTTMQLANSWIEHQGSPTADNAAAIHNIFKDVVLKLHAEGKVRATALNDYYTVQTTEKPPEVSP